MEDVYITGPKNAKQIVFIYPFLDGSFRLHSRMMFNEYGMICDKKELVKFIKETPMVKFEARGEIGMYLKKFILTFLYI